jgi:hypothetical protein
MRHEFWLFEFTETLRLWRSTDGLPVIAPPPQILLSWDWRPGRPIHKFTSANVSSRQIFVEKICHITMKTVGHSIILKDEWMCLLGLVKAAVSIKVPSSPFLATPTAANLVDVAHYALNFYRCRQLACEINFTESRDNLQSSYIELCVAFQRNTSKSKLAR